MNQDALKIRLFASTLKGMAFDWYSTLPEDSIQNWTIIETRFLTHFKGEDHPVTMAQLCSLKQGENESTYDFIHKRKAMAYKMLRCAATSITGRHLPKQQESKDPLHDHRQQIKESGRIPGSIYGG